MIIDCRPPWLHVDLGAPHRCLSWSLNRPGLTNARRVVWRQVRDRDLTPEIDARHWLQTALEQAGEADSVALLTSRDVSCWRRAARTVEGVRAECVATIGLSNAERVGERLPAFVPKWGTINLLVTVSHAMTDAALIEALSIAVQARTLAVLEAAHRRFDEVDCATGTGTDCVVMAAPVAGAQTGFAGLHTAVGEAIGAAVLRAMRSGLPEWRAEDDARQRAFEEKGPR